MPPLAADAGAAPLDTRWAPSQAGGGAGARRVQRRRAAAPATALATTATTSADPDLDPLLPPSPVPTPSPSSLPTLATRSYTYYSFSAAPYDPNSLDELVAVVLMSVAMFLVPAVVVLVHNRAHRSLHRSAARVVRKAWRPSGPATLREDRARLGLEGAAVLLFEREMFRLMALMSALGLVVLIPVHVTSGWRNPSPPSLELRGGGGGSLSVSASSSSSSSAGSAVALDESLEDAQGAPAERALPTAHPTAWPPAAAAKNRFVVTTIQNVPVEPLAEMQATLWIQVFFVLLFSAAVWHWMRTLRRDVTELEQIDDEEEDSGGGGGGGDGDSEAGADVERARRAATATRTIAADCGVFVSGPPKSLSSEDEMLRVLSEICPPGQGPRGVRLLRRDESSADLPWRAILTFPTAESSRAFIANRKTYATKRSRDLLTLCMQERESKLRSRAPSAASGGGVSRRASELLAAGGAASTGFQGGDEDTDALLGTPEDVVGELPQASPAALKSMPRVRRASSSNSSSSSPSHASPVFASRLSERAFGGPATAAAPATATSPTTGPQAAAADPHSPVLAAQTAGEVPGAEMRGSGLGLGVAGAAGASSPLGAGPLGGGDEAGSASQAVELTRLMRLRVEEWHVDRAPEANDIMYDALNVSPVTYWLKQIATTLAFLVVLVFLTTPVSFISFIAASNPQFSSQIQSSYSSAVYSLQTLSLKFADFMFSFLPQLFLVVCDAWLLFGVQLMSQCLEPNFTYSGREASVMGKSFAFLLFNTLVLPCLALTSVGSFVVGLFVSGPDVSPFALLGRVFVTSSGAFSLCFVAVQTWVGAAMDVARLSERMWIALKGCLVRATSPSGASASVTHANFEFEYGSAYAIMLTVLAICLVFSTVVPLILPFGAVYFLLKAAVDEYLLAHVVSPHPLDRSSRGVVARFAVDMVCFPLVVFHVAMVGFFTSSVCVTAARGDVGEDEACVVQSTGAAGELRTRGSPAQCVVVVACLVASAAASVATWRSAGKGRFARVVT